MFILSGSKVLKKELASTKKELRNISFGTLLHIVCLMYPL